MSKRKLSQYLYEENLDIKERIFKRKNKTSLNNDKEMNYFYPNTQYVSKLFTENNYSLESLLANIKTEGKKCPQCKSTNTYYLLSQVNSADEGSKGFIICADCGSRT